MNTVTPLSQTAPYAIGPAAADTLVIDVGGTHVKARIGREDEVKFVSGAAMTPQEMVGTLKEQLAGQSFQRVSMGVPMPVRGGRIVAEPHHLGTGWLGFDFAQAFACPVRIINDAAMQALGSYRNGTMLFLGLGTGLGSALVTEGRVVSLELGHLPYRKNNFEYYVCEERRKKYKKAWPGTVLEVVETLRAAFLPDYIVLGGGNAKKIGALPVGVELGDNSNAFEGGLRLWALS